MPPSPAMRCSPGRDLNLDNHRRGRSYEGGIIPFREKDEDLALFNEMQIRERDNFLLETNDDVDDVFTTKLRYFSDYKLGISVPVRGESSDLLNVDAEKNDYDWLLTPPDTPLFPSLDDETPPVNLVQRGRTRSHPISISRSSTMEKNYKSSRGSASPNRLSPSPRSGTSTLQSRGRPSSAPHTSPTPSLGHASPSRRSSPPSSKPSTPAPRSSTPTPRRMSTGSSGTVPLTRERGTSPVTTNRGNSASPKVRAWQSNIPGFSLDAPPNLRTSLGDRPASYVRGSSPASRNGRQSMSPTASRSVSSSYSHDRDRFSSHSKGSVVSSGDDDRESVQSIYMGSSERSTPKKIGAVPRNRALAFSKKPSKTVSSSSAPKRSFDSALRQMDQCKGPQNMFRPLLSSVPSSTFYVGKTSAAHRALISRNSSVTTSSSSDQGTGGAHDTEGSDYNQDDKAQKSGKTPYPDIHDEVFVFDKVDAVREDNGHRIPDPSSSILRTDFNVGSKVDSQLSGSESVTYHGTDLASPSISVALDISGNFPQASSLEDNLLCSKCGCLYQSIESTEGNFNLCPDCRRADIPLRNTIPVETVAENSRSLSVEISEEYKSSAAVAPPVPLCESPDITDMGERMAVQHEENINGCKSSPSGLSSDILPEFFVMQSSLAEVEQKLASQKVIGQSTDRCSLSDCDTGDQQMQQSSDHSDLKPEVSEGAGISILLRRSSSGKAHLTRGRTFSATSIPYDDLSYVMRGSANSTRSSTGGNRSASSSVDLGSAKQTEICVQRQLSGRKSGTSGHKNQTLGPSASMHEEEFESSLSHVENGAVNVPPVASQEEQLASENTEVDDMSAGVECNSNSLIVAASSSGHTIDNQVTDSLSASFSKVEDTSSYGNDEDLQNNVTSISDVEVPVMTTETCSEEESTVSNSSVSGMDVTDKTTYNLLDIVSEETENGHLGSPESPSDVNSRHSKGAIDVQEPFVVTSSETDIVASVAEPGTSDHAHRIHEDSTVLMGGQGVTNARSLTLEEATDTILFCSSIVHGLAYEAATIAMEKENLVPLEGSRPTVTILGISSDRKDSRGRPAGGKRASKLQKARQRRVETETKPLSGNSESDEKNDASLPRIVGSPTNKVDSFKHPPKLESKCNCSVM